MSNVFYLDDFRSKAEPPAPSFIPTNRRAEQLRLLEERNAAYRTLLAARAARELREPSTPTVVDALQSATPIVLYFVSYGRNAWHSTWTQKYQKNTLMASYEESCVFIGERMTQGTAFKLTVTPGWHLQFSSEAFLVCEINTNRPFSRLVNAAFTVPGVSKDEALMLLMPTSSLWQGPVPRHDSIIVQQTNRTASEFVSWEEADDERWTTDYFWLRQAEKTESAADPSKDRIYDPRKPCNYGRYFRDTRRETLADFYFRPCKKGGPSDFDCELFRVLAAAEQVVGAT